MYIHQATIIYIRYFSRVESIMTSTAGISDFESYTRTCFDNMYLCSFIVIQYAKYVHVYVTKGMHCRSQAFKIIIFNSTCCLSNHK